MMVKRAVWNKDMIDVLQEYSKQKTLKEICDFLNEVFNLNLTTRQVETAKYRYNIKSFEKRGQYNQVFTTEMKEFISKKCKGLTKSEMMKLLKKNFETKATIIQLTNFYNDYKLTSEVDAKFKANEKHPNYKKIGSEKIDSRGRTYIKIKKDDSISWRLKSHVVWEEAHGQMPNNHLLIYLDRDEKNWSLENLALADNRTRCSLARKKLSDNRELNKVIVNTTRLTFAIEKISKEKGAIKK